MRIENQINELPKHLSKKYGRRRLDQIKYIVIHHFGGSISVKEAATLHVSKGWPGIGYFAVIDGTSGKNNLNGSKVVITNYLDTVSYGVANNNTQCLSIAVRGDYQTSLPNAMMLDDLHELIYLLRGLLGPLPIKVHSDFVNTKCPGDMLRNWVRDRYPEPIQVKIPLSKFAAIWCRIKKWFTKDPDHV